MLKVNPKQTKVSLLRVLGIVWIAAAIGFAGFILVQGSAEFLKHPFRLNLWYVLLAFVVALPGWWVTVWAWHLILASYGIHHRFREDFRIYCYGTLGLAIPGGIWSVVGRTVMYERLGDQRSYVAEAGLLETFVMGLAGMSVYSVLSVTRSDISLFRRPEIGILFSLLVLVMIQPKVFNSLRSWLRRRFNRDAEISNVNFSVADLVKWLALEAVVIMLGGISLYCLLISVIPASISILLPIMAAWAAGMAASNLFFWLPGSPIFRDGTMLMILSPSLPLPLVVVFVLLTRLYSTLSLFVMAGAIWLWADSPIAKRLYHPNMIG